MTKINFKAAVILLLMGTIATAEEVKLYEIEVPVESRSISFENPTGEKGKGGMAASKIGVGRKGLPAKRFKPGQTYTLCDINGPGAIRHIWVTVSKDVETLQGIVVRAYWDGQEQPSIEAPLGAFFGIMHGKVGAYQSAVHSVNPEAGMNIWLEMPFAKQAKITLTNESTKSTSLFYYIDYTLEDKLPAKFGRLHAIYRRENPTTLKNDFEILPKRTGSGRFLGCVLGIRPLTENWWGEGEVKVYLDGDSNFPTICGTGTEDYVGQSWGLQNVGLPLWRDVPDGQQAQHDLSLAHQGPHLLEKRRPYHDSANRLEPAGEDKTAADFMNDRMIGAARPSGMSRFPVRHCPRCLITRQESKTTSLNQMQNRPARCPFSGDFRFEFCIFVI